jgi:biopolymer transport protein ExbD/biopolymer transport protein TolR
MAMAIGTPKGKGVVPQMNVTPLVDVVLVLLIIFMVITPLLSKQFWVHTPRQEKQEIAPDQVQQDPSPPLVLHVGTGRSITVNGSDIAFEELADRLRRMFAARDDHVLFFDAADDASYGFTVEVMDRAREGGAVTIATLTSALGAPDAP